MSLRLTDKRALSLDVLYLASNGESQLRQAADALGLARVSHENSHTAGTTLDSTGFAPSLFPSFPKKGASGSFFRLPALETCETSHQPLAISHQPLLRILASASTSSSGSSPLQPHSSILLHPVFLPGWSLLLHHLDLPSFPSLSHHHQPSPLITTSTDLPQLR